MTEDEAKTKWCPMARVIHFHDNDGPGISPAAGNRGAHGQPKPESLCIASDCMMWVATDNEYPTQPSETTVRHPLSNVKPAGHCGLTR